MAGFRKSAKQKVHDKIASIFEKTKNMLPNGFDTTLYKTDVHEEIKDNAWGAACILIKRKVL